MKLAGLNMFPKKLLVLLVVAITCSSCMIELEEDSSSRINISVNNKSNNISSREIIAADKIGKELIKEYDVQYDQSVRFNYKHKSYAQNGLRTIPKLEDALYESHGAYAITSIDEARRKYPQWTIPENLGDYKFVDFTLYPIRTSAVFPAFKKDTVEVLTDNGINQYYLCYKKGSSRFKISVIPISDDGISGISMEDIYDSVSYSIPWPSHPRSYFIPDSDEENNKQFFELFMMLPAEDEKYAFLVCKIASEDCLEDVRVSFTKKEASSIYKAIKKDFLNN